MANKKTSVSIGIPAYNEEANIGFLVQDIFKLKLSSLNLNKIIIYSDGSTDKTEEIIKKLKNNKILLLHEKKRRGIANAQNQLLKNSDSEIVVLLNADTRIKDPSFLTEIVSPIINKQADLTDVRSVELGKSKFFGKVISAGSQFRKFVYTKHNSGNNIYTCSGLARAFSQRLYRELEFKQNSSEDAYSYLFCISRGYKYKFVKSTYILYKNPDNFKDHRNQSARFLNSRSHLVAFFDKELVDDSYKLPFMLVLEGMIYSFSRFHIYFLSYLVVLSLNIILSQFAKEPRKLWEIPASTKVLEISNGS